MFDRFPSALQRELFGWAGPVHADDSGVTAASLALDSVVFEDGRVAGEDTYDIGRHPHGRHEAALMLSRQVLEAGQAGDTAEAAIARIADAGRAAPGWPWRLAMSARRAQERLRKMPDLPAPPRLWRARV